MAKDKKQQAATKRMQKRIDKLTQNIRGNMDSLYQQTYMSTSSLDSDLERLSDKITINIDTITKSNSSTAGVPNTSKLYNRLISDKNSDGTDSISSIIDAFQDNALMDNMYESFVQNYALKDMDNEIDAICKYMPKLLEALETRKDNVLSADHFSKDFLTIKGVGAEDEKMFDLEAKKLKENYKLLEFFEQVYDDTAKYGEQFVYHVPYRTAIQRLLARKPTTRTDFMRESCISQGIDYDSISESALTDNDKILFNINSSGISMINESYSGSSSKITLESFVDKANKDADDFSKNFTVEFDSSGIVESAVQDTFTLTKNKFNVAEHSIWRESTNNSDMIRQQTDATGSLSFANMKKPKEENKFYAKDGLAGYNADPDSIKVTVPGCVLKVLDHTQVSPIYMNDTNMGYYYIEFYANNDPTSMGGFSASFSDPITSSSPGATLGMENQMAADKQEMLARHVSSQLARYIDLKFVNSNQDLREEIYTILKHNDTFNSPQLDRVKVTFIQPDEMTHVYFRKNKYTHRGISDLDRALIPAKMWSALWVTNSFGNLSRGQDKRVYYVKQQVETNIAKTLLNVVQQIKMGNFGMRQFRSINSALGMTGRFNDYIIPTNASGDSPIQFEVMPGQQFDLKTDLMDILEEMAVNATDVPLELIQARMSMDYATHYTMSSIKFLRKVYKRQGQYQQHLTNIFSRIYMCEYEKSVTIEVKLPPPVFLNVTNTNQILENADQYTTKMVELELGQNADPDLKDAYKRNLMDEYLGTYIDVSRNRDTLEKTKMQLKIAAENQDQDQ